MKTMKVADVARMRDMDRLAMERYRIPDSILMENAGGAVVSVILDYLKERGSGYGRFCEAEAVVFSGSGNNGGDGFVVARRLFSYGIKVSVVLIGKEEKLKNSPLSNYMMLAAAGIDRLVIQPSPSQPDESAAGLKVIKQRLESCTFVVDALFGTGLAREVSGIFREVIELINNSGKPVFSVDIPSGINGDTGQVMGTAVRATKTITFSLPKRGNLIYPGYDYCGKLYLSHISFPPEIYHNPSIEMEVNLPRPLEKRNPAGHKGSFGDVLFIAGARRYYGAPFFSAMSFMKAGGGYARLASSESVIPFVASRGSELVMVPLNETHSGSIAYGNLDELLELSEKVDMVVIGPGLSLDEETGKLVLELVRRIEKPMLIDGDGITFVSRERGVLSKRNAPTILTPHPGEMARLVGKKVVEVTENGPEVLKAFLKDLEEEHKREEKALPETAVVLKGAHSLVGSFKRSAIRGNDAEIDGAARISINLTGNPGMATAGSGDVLAGTIAAMYGLGLKVSEAARAGVFIHGLAGDLAAERLGQDGITAGDIMQFLPEAVRRYREDYGELVPCFYGKIKVV